MIPTGKPLLGRELKVINIGLELFAATLERYDVPVVHLDWQPPAGGDPHLVDLLRRLKSNAVQDGQGEEEG